METSINICSKGSGRACSHAVVATIWICVHQWTQRKFGFLCVLLEFWNYFSFHMQWLQWLASCSWRKLLSLLQENGDTPEIHLNCNCGLLLCHLQGYNRWEEALNHFKFWFFLCWFCIVLACWCFVAVGLPLNIPVVFKIVRINERKEKWIFMLTV